MQRVPYVVIDMLKGKLRNASIFCFQFVTMYIAVEQAALRCLLDSPKLLE